MKEERGQIDLPPPEKITLKNPALLRLILIYQAFGHLILT